MVEFLITFAVAVIVLCVIWYLLKQLPLPPEAAKFLHIAMVVVVAIVVIWLLLSISGHATLPRLR